MDSGRVVIEVNNLTKTYHLYDKPGDRVREIFSLKHKKYARNYDALSGISFRVYKGETLGIIGKNGAGKSTLLKMLTGVTTPTSGDIRIEGAVSALLELGTGFNPEYNGYENIYLNGSMRGYSRPEMDVKIDEIKDFADIGDYILQPIKTYSSGMLARLAFAVMVCFKPEILIVDEALSVGDVFFQQKCNTYMKEEMQGVTKLLVTHDMNSVANMADRVILLDKGRIVQEGKPLEVIQNYLKIMHTEVFAEAHGDPKSQKVDAQEHIEEWPGRSGRYGEDGNSWIAIEKSGIGGAGDAVITGCRLTVNGEPADVVKPGDTIEMYARIQAKKTIEHMIIGYIFKDKYGNSIVGENTLGSDIKLEGIEEGKEYIYKISILWPEVKEGDYFVTLGVGEGTDQMVHTIQCWAHNIIHVEALALVPMHGIVNNRILSAERIYNGKMTGLNGGQNGKMEHIEPEV